MGTIKLRSIDTWRYHEGDVIPLPGKEDARTVTIDFNVSEQTILTVLQDRRSTLLRVVEPHQCPVTISFVVRGDCAIVPETEGDVYWRSDDGLILSYDVLTESFTKLEQRMEMTPEMEVTILRSQIRKEQRAREVAELLLLRQQREDAAAAGADDDGVVHEEPVGANAGTAKPAAVAGNSPAPEPEPAGDGDAPAKPTAT